MTLRVSVSAVLAVGRRIVLRRTDSIADRPGDDAKAASEVSARRGSRRRRLAAIGGGAIALMLFLVIAHRPLLVGFARSFRVEDPLLPADALVLLLGGDSDRPRKAAQLFHLRYAPIILMGSDPDMEMNRRSLLASGVPANAIRVLGPVGGTYGEAVRVREYVRAHHLRRITIVTTAFHTRRARWTFHRVLAGTHVDIRMVASTSGRFHESAWYTTSYGRTVYLRELLKSIGYRFGLVR